MPKPAACTTSISPPLLPSSPPLLHCDAGPLPAPSGRLGPPAPPTARPLAAESPSLAGFSLGSHHWAAPWPRLRLRAEGGWEAGPRGRGRSRAGRSTARCRDAICHCRAWAPAPSQAPVINLSRARLLTRRTVSIPRTCQRRSPESPTVPAASLSKVPHPASQSLPPCPRIKVRTPLDRGSAPGALLAASRSAQAASDLPAIFPCLSSGCVPRVLPGARQKRREVTPGSQFGHIGVEPTPFFVGPPV